MLNLKTHGKRSTITHISFVMLNTMIIPCGIKNEMTRIPLENFSTDSTNIVNTYMWS